jgi:hypothetical protein
MDINRGEGKVKARTSQKLGVFSLLLLLFCGLYVFHVFYGRDDVRDPYESEVASWIAFISVGVAAGAAFAALVLGILGLMDINRDEGKVYGTGVAVSGLVTATLTLLILAREFCVALPILDWNFPWPHGH